MDTLFLPAAQLGGTVFTVVAFLTYLTRRERSQDASQAYRDREAVTASNRRARSDIILAKSLQRLTTMVEINTNQSSKNTKTLGKSKISIDKNTDVIDKNTEAIAQNGNGNGK